MRRFVKMVGGLKYELNHGSFEEYQGDFNACITSPPYNIGSKSEKKITNRKHGGYDAKSWGAIRNYADNLPEDEYQESQKEFLNWCGRHLRRGGVVVYNHKARHKVIDGYKKLVKPDVWIEKSNLMLVDEAIWNRGSTHNHTLPWCYQQHEYVYILQRPGDDWHFQPKIKSVWDIAPERGSFHDAPFPGKFAETMLKCWSNPGDLVCDPYSGSGTTMVAALCLGRSFVGFEVVKDYFDAAVARFEKAAEQAA
jgi:DNA modification methylase